MRGGVGRLILSHPQYRFARRGSLPKNYLSTRQKSHTKNCSLPNVRFCHSHQPRTPSLTDEPSPSTAICQSKDKIQSLMDHRNFAPPEVKKTVQGVTTRTISLLEKFYPACRNWCGFEDSATLATDSLPSNAPSMTITAVEKSMTP